MRRFSLSLSLSGPPSGSRASGDKKKKWKPQQWNYIEHTHLVPLRTQRKRNKRMIRYFSKTKLFPNDNRKVSERRIIEVGAYRYLASDSISPALLPLHNPPFACPIESRFGGVCGGRVTRPISIRRFACQRKEWSEGEGLFLFSILFDLIFSPI